MSTEFDLDRPWQVDPRVSLRPEPFGALLYHFGTRRLSFLKNQRVLAVVRSLDDCPTARAACEAAGVRAAELPAYAQPLFLRLQRQIETTATFKYRKVDLVADGFDPGRTKEAIYFHNPGKGYVKLTPATYAKICAGEFKL